MAANIIDGKSIAAQVRADIAKQVEDIKAKNGTIPGLAVVLVGEDPASAVYVRSKHKACQEVGMKSWVYTMPETTTQQELLAMVDKLNADPEVHGILVQSPPPPQIDEMAIVARIDPKKDVDGFHVQNAGSLFVGLQGFVACTPLGVMHLLKTTGVSLSGKRAVVVGRSNIVGKPMAMLLLNENCTVTICHSRTQDLAGEIRRADIVVAAVGRPNMITGDMLKPGAIVLDVGINRGVDGKLVGDVDFDSAKEVASYITPVPGGVGPMTIAMLLHNTLQASQNA